MSFHNNEFDRKVLPIWDDSALSGGLSENTSLRNTTTTVTSENLSDKLILELKRSDKVGIAVELLNVASLEREDEALTFAARRILKESGLPTPITILAQQVLGQVEEVQKNLEFYKIRKLRAHLSQQPRNALAWVDLAREHVILGNSSHAEKAMTIALNLEPSHRWVTRVASRLFVHINLIDKSHRLLMSHPGIRNDPWIASAEIAVSELSGRTSKNISTSKKLLEAGFNPKHTAELASALGTLELSAGANKKAKNYFRNSLEAPNRNVLAQVKWVEQAHDLKAGVQITNEQMEMAFEAKAWENYINGNISKALYFCMEWYKSEPYSSKPPMLATYLAALVDKYDIVIGVAIEGLKTNPDNLTLKLNKAYAEIAKIGIPTEQPVDEATILAWVTFFKDIIRKDKSSASHAAANLGMLCYRIGYLENGKDWYNYAETLCKSESAETLAMCSTYHAREAIIAKAAWADTVYSTAKDLVQKASASELPSALFYMKKIEILKHTPDNWPEILGAANKPLIELPPSREIFTYKSKGIESTVKFYLLNS
ncbi:hypothetical protein FFI16_004485 [Pseudomonas sp. KBS0710]|uniref:hypothetical protein n=1 Tax=Pseudomonas sp. KBS0710 TaxID=1179667 RepID=UPI00110EA252|nr:hypothetical protein [Pseudomonas sp. KBS0710]TSD75704.1 hypothetical protein FFI16_004485 [Pseudomonas sp. KBS0710]